MVVLLYESVTGKGGALRWFSFLNIKNQTPGLHRFA